MAGGSLRALLQDPNAVITDETAASIIQSTCNALIEMNLKNISHNDLKPDNILIKDLANPASVKLADFGLAQTMGNQMDIGQRGTKL